MKVKNLIGTIKIILDILEVYQDKTVNQMLLDIKEKVSGPIENSNKKLRKATDFNVNEIIKEITSLSDDEMVSYLDKYKKEEIERIFIEKNIRYSSKDTKSKLINNLANHYSLVNLNKQMSERYSPTSSFSNNKKE